MKYLLNFITFVILSFTVSCGGGNALLEEPNRTEEEMVELEFSIPVSDLNTRGFEDDDKVATLWSIEFYLKYQDELTKIFDLDPADIYNGKVYVKDGNSILYDLSNRSFTLMLRFPKRNSPKDYTLAMCGYTALGTTIQWGFSYYNGDNKFKIQNNKLTLESSLRTDSDTELYAFHLYEKLSDTNSWNDVKKTFTFKRLDSNITVITNSDKDLKSGFSCRYIFPTLSDSNSMRFIQVDNWDDDRATSKTCYPGYFEYFISFKSLSKYIFDTGSISYNIKFHPLISGSSLNDVWSTFDSQLYPGYEEGGYKQLTSFNMQFSKTGELPTIQLPSNVSYLEDRLWQLEGKSLKYIILLNTATGTKSFRYAVIPLPEKMYACKKYIFKNKPGTDFFSDPISFDDLSTRGGNSPSPHIVSPDDIIIEEYDMDEPLPFEVAK